MCDFSTHIPCVKKCILTWKLTDPATASQLQSAFKVKTMTAAAAVATASGADADTANRVESNWSHSVESPSMVDPQWDIWY